MTRGGISFVRPESEEQADQGENKAFFGYLALPDAVMCNHGGTDYHRGLYQYVLLSTGQAHFCCCFLCVCVGGAAFL